MVFIDILQHHQLVSRDRQVMDEDGATGSIYSGDYEVDMHHPMFISSYHTTKIHTVYFPTCTTGRSTVSRNQEKPLINSELINRRTISASLLIRIRITTQEQKVSVPFSARKS